jgi:hypothetical protein
MILYANKEFIKLPAGQLTLLKKFWGVDIWLKVVVSKIAVDDLIVERIEIESTKSEVVSLTPGSIISSVSLI